MEQRYLSMIRRWLWLLVLATVVAAGTTYWLSSQQPTIYGAIARLIVGPGVDSPSPDLDALRASGQLMQTYAELATTRPVLQAVIDMLSLDMDPNTLGSRIEARSNQETQILTLTVKDGNPGRAAVIVNALADTLVRLSPSNDNSPAARLRAQMQTQAGNLEQDIASIEGTLGQLESEFRSLEEVDRQRLLLTQIAEERKRLSEANNTLALLYDTLQQASTNQVKVVELADGAYPIPTQLRLQVLVGALAGLVLATVIMLAFEFFDDTIKTTGELALTTGVPLLGAIARHKALAGAGRERLIVQALPESRAAENYRVLGTKLLFSNGAAGRLRSALLSSAQMSEDTGEIAANLAVVLAQTGSRVVLVDANLYNPSIGQLFGIADRLGGLTDVLTRQAKTPKLTAVDWAPGLSVLPSGPISYDSFSLLSSSRMVELLEQLESQADIVIITASPLLSFADSLILASRVDGVVLLARSGKTRRDVINDVIKSLRSLDAQVIGTVFDYNRSIFWPSFTRRKAKQVLPFPSDRQFSDEDTLAGQSESLNLGKTS